MTGGDMISKALLMLGLSDEQGNTTNPRYQTASLSALNTVYADLYYKFNTEGFKEISLHENIDLPERVVFDVMPYGVAAHIATAIGDGENQQFYAEIYNQKRKICGGSSVSDTLPTVD